MNLIDLTGQRFGYLTVVKRAPDANGKTMWLCRCDCGCEKIVQSWDLTHGRTMSCGCHKHDKNRTHGMSKTKLYNAWKQMKARCLNTSHKMFPLYGGRGISVCDEWMQFEPFRDWALANGYSEELTLDRIDVNGGYCPENCRWTTMKAQGNNRRDNHFIEAFGERRTLSEWCAITGLKSTTIITRLIRHSPEDALSRPVRVYHRKAS